MTTLVFNGPIQYPATRSLRTACCAYVNAGETDIQILFSSNGGSVEDGLSLYTFLRALPVTLTMHNVGSVDSIAIAVFLAGARRRCTPPATFLFHDFTWTTAAQTVTRKQIAEQYFVLETGRKKMKELLKLHTSLTDQDLDALKILDDPAVKGSAFAHEKGIVHEIQEAAVPATTKVFNVEY